MNSVGQYWLKASTQQSNICSRATDVSRNTLPHSHILHSWTFSPSLQNTNEKQELHLDDYGHKILLYPKVADSQISLSQNMDYGLREMKSFPF